MSAALRPQADAPAQETAGDFVEVEGKDLPIHCPNPRMPLWASHPRVFLDIVHTGKAKCPYCGTEYRLRPGTAIPAGH